jgi:hypothetical protein
MAVFGIVGVEILVCATTVLVKITAALYLYVINFCRILTMVYLVLNELCFWTLSIVWCLKNKQN